MDFQRLVHSDRTFEAVDRLVRETFGCEADRLLMGRVRWINVWRPIGSTVYNDPLTLANWRTISIQDDLVPLTTIYPGREIRTLASHYNKNHRWYFMKEQVRIASFPEQDYEPVTPTVTRLGTLGIYTLQVL